jgi:murein DD-endopeptidase MepM/ murein hydrolase activator NlpD
LKRSRISVFVLSLTLVASLAGSAQVAAATGSKPFIWPTRGKVTQPYGCTGYIAEPRYGSCQHFHGGIDIAYERGTAIRATAAGIVSHVGWDPWGTRAWMVIINHGGGMTSWYAHLRGKRIAGLRKGTRVRQGEVIGYMGDTGMATGVHLHWAVLKSGRYVNPKNYVEGLPYRPRGDNGEPTSAASCDGIWIASVAAGLAVGAVGEGDNASGSDTSCPG